MSDDIKTIFLKVHLYISQLWK